MNLSFNEISDGIKSNVLEHRFQTVYKKDSENALTKKQEKVERISSSSNNNSFVSHTFNPLVSHSSTNLASNRKEYYSSTNPHTQIHTPAHASPSRLNTAYLADFSYS